MISPQFIVSGLLSVYCNLPPHRVKEIPPLTFWPLSDVKLKSLRNKLFITIQAIDNDILRRENEKEIARQLGI